MDIDRIAEELKLAADREGFLPVLELFGKNVRTRIYLSGDYWNSPIADLSLSVRSGNALMRSGIHTVGQTAEVIMGERGLNSIRNLGKKSINEIKTSVLVHGYEQLSDSEQLDFWRAVAEDNSRKK